MEVLEPSKRLTKWLLDMGYDEKIPTNMKAFCNPCTILIWEQLIQTVKPKDEIDYICNNILINKSARDKVNGSNVDFLRYDKKSTLKEIKVWEEKKHLKYRILAIKNDIAEKQTKLNHLTGNNKIRYMKHETLKQRITENQKCLFLLNKRFEQLKMDINEVEEMLTLARNLTPVEDEQNNIEVSDTLKLCSEKLEKIIEKQNESQVSLRINSENIFELKTPRSKIFRCQRAFSSNKKKALFSSTKIVSQVKSKPKQDHNLSMGLLDDFSFTFDSLSSASSLRDTNFSNVNMCYDLDILNDNRLNNLVEEMLYKTNRSIILNALFEMNHIAKSQLVDLIVDNNKKISSISNIGGVYENKMLMKLYGMHVDYELKSKKTQLVIKQLEKKIYEAQNNISSSLSPLNVASYVVDYIKLQRKEAALIKGIEYMHKTVDLMQQFGENQVNLEIYKEKILNIEDNIFAKISSIECKCDAFKQFYDLVTQSRSEACMLAKKLGQFTVDINWTAPLSSNLNTTELNTFLNFPLEYNKMTLIGNNKIRVCDLPLTTIPCQDDIDSNDLYGLVSLLQNPCSPIETILEELIKTKVKMNYYKSLKYTLKNLETKGYTLEEFKRQEYYIGLTIEKLYTIINSTACSEAMGLLRNIKEATSLWMQMPIKNFISNKRSVNGLPYSHYEKQYDYFYKQL